MTTPHEAGTALAFHAMQFAFQVHAVQKRKYTNNPYTDHLAEVAGIVATVDTDPTHLAVAWLHDCIEDQGVLEADLKTKFGEDVATGVALLSDLEQGNRAQRKAASRDRLANAPGWVQTIKVADLISNTSSIVEHDWNFAKIYLEEKRLLLDVLTKANPDLLRFAKQQLINLPKEAV